MLWFLNNITDISRSGWLTAVGEADLSVTVSYDVNHVPMLDLGPRSEDLNSFLRRAVERFRNVLRI